MVVIRTIVLLHIQVSMSKIPDEQKIAKETGRKYAQEIPAMCFIVFQVVPGNYSGHPFLTSQRPWRFASRLVCGRWIGGPSRQSTAHTPDESEPPQAARGPEHYQDES